MSNQLRPQFPVEDQATTPQETGRLATVTALYRNAGTAPNMAPEDPPEAPHSALRPPVTVPYGWQLVCTPAGWMLTYEPAEWAVISRCIKGRHAGRSYGDIAAELDAEGAPVWNETRRDESPRWHKERVRRLVGRYDPDQAPAKAQNNGRPRQRGARRASIDTDEGFERMLREAADTMEQEQLSVP